MNSRTGLENRPGTLWRLAEPLWSRVERRRGAVGSFPQESLPNEEVMAVGVDVAVEVAGQGR